MGNKSINGIPRKKTQPQQILPSGEPGFGGSAGGGNADEKLIIKLVRLDIPTINIAAKFDEVIVTWNIDGFYCFYNQRVLGKVPNNYNIKLLISQNYYGTIIDLNSEVPNVTIQIEL